jgi:hypothetical protein
MHVIRDARSFLPIPPFLSRLDDLIDGWITEPRFSILGIISSSFAHLLDEPYHVDGAECIYECFVSSLSQFLWIRYHLDHLIYPSQWIDNLHFWFRYNFFIVLQEPVIC